MSRRVPTALLIAVGVLLTAGVLGGATGAVGAQTATATNTTVQAAETVIEIKLQPDGDARWQISERVVVSTTAERAAFEDIGEDFEGRGAGSLGLETVRRAAQRTDGETNRSMAISDVSHDATLENASLADKGALNGTLTVAFAWSNFAREDGDRFVVEDVFAAGEERWLRGLTADQRLIIALPEGYGASSAPKGFEQNELRWEGPTTFEPGYLRIVYSGDIPPPNPQNGPPVLAWAALAVALVALVVAGGLLARRRGVEIGWPAGGADADAESGESAETEPAHDEPEETEEDLELLSDEERVERLLTENGGRMKQATIVKETGWSNAKVSQLLSRMEDEGAIQKLRIGRENLIAFPDEEIGDFEY